MPGIDIFHWRSRRNFQVTLLASKSYSCWNDVSAITCFTPMCRRAWSSSCRWVKYRKDRNSILVTLFAIVFCTKINAVGIVLDKTWGRARPGHPGSHLVTHPLHAAREESSLFTTRFVPEGRRRLHVGLHDICVHGTDGVLSGEHCPRRFGCARSETRASATAAVLEHRGFDQDRQDLRYCCQGNALMAIRWSQGALNRF